MELISLQDGFEFRVLNTQIGFHFKSKMPFQPCYLTHSLCGEELEFELSSMISFYYYTTHTSQWQNSKSLLKAELITVINNLPSLHTKNYSTATNIDSYKV